MNHAFDTQGGILCGLPFTLSPAALSAGDKVTTRHEIVDCPECRKRLDAQPATLKGCLATNADKCAVCPMIGRGCPGLR